MAKGGRHIYKRGARKLTLGQWMIRLDRRPADLAKAVGVTPSYISELISGKKPNPGIALLLTISEWLGLTVNDLFLPPPPQTAELVSPTEMATLSRLLDRIKPPGRR